MEKAIPEQEIHVLNCFEEKGLNRDKIQAIIDAGFLSDVADAVMVGKEINREAVRKALGLDYIPLLELVDTVVIPATGKFVARDKLVVDKSDKVDVKIAWLGTTFKRLLLGKIEEPTDESELRYHRLLKPLPDGSIIAELGGESKVETTLAKLFSLLEKQGNGEDGVLLVNGFANIFYIRDINGVLRDVQTYCSSDGWLVYYYSVERPHRWVNGYQVFSPQF